MHDTALLTGEAFFRCYGDPILSEAEEARALVVLDVGSLDINGSLRPFAPMPSVYTGVDLVAGPGVDTVLDDPHVLPYPNNLFDLVVSTSCLEHDPLFWLTFIQMARVVVPGGFIYISAPSNGHYHGHPGDCWRFFPDAAAALAQWATRSGQPLQLVETFLMPPQHDVWIDNVMVFGKPPVPERTRIVDYLMRGLA